MRPEFVSGILLRIRSARALVPLLLVFVACRTTDDLEAEQASVEHSLQGFFRAISESDFDALRASTTADYVLLEDGLVWNTDSLVAAVEDLQEGGLTISYSFADREVYVHGPIAWMTYRNTGVLSGAAGADTLRWLESAVFRKEGGSWRMALLHSTRVSSGEN